ncbi:hypothetical protein PUBBUKKERS_32 [Escherichia phage vB_EcoD_Pubbukkers]|uniref:Uncharacterized protein n=1 Tax=Escherichia phage vB_EcoD_Pubbukkers TaxID=2894793 RepID=A0AAE8YSG3_9CAUD|nr:hypothetical protein P9614_gp32 [Escherichia phage vB_EcoD_Pubbukkers]UGO50001.1 hypothetical protein PUBBUKKERS_32 [Escherichia phage vB_EcoD_Pubbukkers]
MNILVVDRSLRVVDEIVKRYQINPRENKVRRVIRPEQLLGMDLTGWLVMTARCHLVCDTLSARAVRMNLIEELK